MGFVALTSSGRTRNIPITARRRHRGGLALLAAIALGLVVVAGTPALAATDLAVDSVELTPQGSSTHVTVTLGIVFSDDQAPYEFTVTLTRTRGGEVTTLGWYPNLEVKKPGQVSGNNCEECPASGNCTNSCKVKVDESPVTGTCKLTSTGNCSNGNNCICSIKKTVSFGLYEFEVGDVVTVTVTPDSGVEELSDSNNELSASY